MIRVFLLDDHALVRTGFRLILGQADGIEVVGEAASGEDALPQIRALKPDILLCDLHLPGVSGLEVTERVQRWEQGTRVIVVSMQEDGPMPRRLLEVGAAGYLGKGGEAGELLRAVREVAAGRRYISPALAQRLALGAVDGGGSSPFDRLSPRELEVVMLLSHGRRIEYIARQLNISVKTVSTHKLRALAKLEIGDVVALSRMAAQYGLIESPG